jgi:hypothetical protein
LLLAAAALTGCGGKKPPPTLHFKSEPELRPPVVTVLKDTRAAAPGYIFIAPKMDAPQYGPEILDDQGQPVWFDPIAAEAADFRVQTYRGKPVLTWWQGPSTAPILGTGLGHYVIMNSSYKVIARVQAGLGPESGDLHEFQLTPQGTALITAYRVVRGNLSAEHGAAKAKVADSIVQIVDVASGRVLFTWHSIGHIPLSDSYIPVPPPGSDAAKTPYDYFHVNSVAEEPDGNLLISARNTRAVYELDRKTGKVLWELGGKHSSFKMGPRTNFAWQHDARRQPDGTITIFDDEAAPPVAKKSRAIRLRLDMKTMAASLVQSDSVARVLASSQGNAETLPNGDLFVGWGAVPRFTEFAPNGRVVFDATFSAGDDSYRDYRFQWVGTPTTRPAIDAAKSKIYASWNGATQVASWQVLAGDSAGHLAPVGTRQSKTGFETVLAVDTKAQRVAVEAFDANGKKLGTSATVNRDGGQSTG